MLKRIICLVLALVCALTMITSCATAAAPETTVSESTYDREDTDYVVFEAVFLDNGEIDEIFREIRGDAPYRNVTPDYHVTVTFLPDTDVRELYGADVEVHIVGYKAGEVPQDDGSITHNEGLEVELYSEDKTVNDYLMANVVNYHITGSYDDYPQYTLSLDFSDAEPLDITVHGTLGAYLNGNWITFDGSVVDKPIKDR
ncbi:hypothetical protein SAMN02910456_00694 [Ruminococcaceae bacterium YRB3002]|nr:hypothetical protein SAMN02910456_00694 [Ruminococcaceae bacterium YRB3002]